jgi:Subtilase family
MKRTRFTVLLLLIGLLLASCGGSAAPTSAPPTTAPTIAAAATSAATTAAESTEISIEPVNPTPAPTQSVIQGTPPASGDVITGPDGTQVAIGTSPVINPPPTLDELLKLYPDLKAFIDKLPPTLSEADLAELYKRVIQIYKDKGATGVAVFLKDSGILDKLGIPLSYIDLLTAYGDKGDIQAVEKLARERQLISSKNEIVGYLAIDSKANLTAVSDDLKALGLSVYSYFENTEEVEIGIPLPVLSQFQTPGALLGYLTKIPKVNHVVGFRLPTPKTTSSVNQQKAPSKGAVVIGADKWQKAGITGKGVRVGILDLGFGGIAQNAGKLLPPADKIQSNVPLEDLDGHDDPHGTAVAMVIHGVAPDAELYLAYIDASSDSGLQDAIQYLEDNKVQIINSSLQLEIGPRDGTWGWSALVDQVVSDANVLWVNSAGNEAVDHTAFQYKDNGKGVHAFSEKVSALPFVPFSPVTKVEMSWNGNWNGKEKDEYDFSVLDKDGNEVVTAAEAKNGKKNDFPFQLVTFDATPKEVYYLVIHKAKGKEDKVLDIFIPNAIFPDWAIVADHSISMPGDANSALTVGSTGLTKDKLEIYSSQGPTNDDRIKPDVTAPGGEVLPVAKTGFFGTSASAPLVAGAAALVLQKFPDMTPEELKAFLTTNVKDLGDKGPDNLYGAGRLALPDPGGVTQDNPGTTDETPVPDTAGPTASITNIDTKFNVKYKGQKGMAISVSFTVDNFKGKKGIVAALFFDKNDKPLPTKDENYKIGNGLGTGFTFTAKSDKTAFDDAGMFIPNSAFSAVPASTKEFYYVVLVLDPDNLDKPLAASDKVTVKVQK